MEIYTEKHLNRVERYIRGTYYLDHLNQKEQTIWMFIEGQQIHYIYNCLIFYLSYI